MKTYISLLSISILVIAVSCKRSGCTDEKATNYDPKAKKEDGSCTYPSDEDTYSIPSNYSFTDASGNNTVDFSGQTQRLNQLTELVNYMKLGTSQVIDAQWLKDMFANTNGNGGGHFSGTYDASKQLKDKCFSLDQSMFENWMDSIAQASSSYSITASNGQAGTLTSGTSTYLLDANGIEYAQLIEKGLMGAVFMDQALNGYFGSAKMNVDNTTAVDPLNGKYYTTMQHHWDEAFGYFAVPVDFPTSPAIGFWGKYCNSQNANLNSNSIMMSNFLKGRAAIVAGKYTDRDAAISAIRVMWEDISANQAITYVNNAITFFGNDNAKFFHNLSEAYAFSWNLRYAPVETRRMSQTEVSNLIAMYGDNFWNLSLIDLQNIKATLEAKY